LKKRNLERERARERGTYRISELEEGREVLDRVEKKPRMH
jgi:hypothetical protein